MKHHRTIPLFLPLGIIFLLISWPASSLKAQTQVGWFMQGGWSVNHAWGGTIKNYREGFKQFDSDPIQDTEISGRVDPRMGLTGGFSLHIRNEKLPFTLETGMIITPRGFRMVYHEAYTNPTSGSGTKQKNTFVAQFQYLDFPCNVRYPIGNRWEVLGGFFLSRRLKTVTKETVFWEETMGGEVVESLEPQVDYEDYRNSARGLLIGGQLGIATRGLKHLNFELRLQQPMGWTNENVYAHNQTSLQLVFTFEPFAHN